MAGDSATGEPEWVGLARLLAEEIRKRRKAEGLSHPRLAERIGYTRQYVSLAERPKKGLPSAFLVQALDDALDAGGALVALRDQADAARKACRSGTSSSTMANDANPTGSGPGQPPASLGEVKNAKRRELITAAVVAPDLLNRVLSEAAAEAMEFTRLTGFSAVGSGTLEHLELVITDLNRGYSHEPPAELFAVARTYRSRVDEFIRGRHTLKELQDLYVYAGCLSELLAWLAHDLGNPRTARAYAVDSYAHAEQ
ncbi:MAG: helix-turn-helix domain-containing protein, partial [Gemmatimonadales bacterium]